jgi:hypothetical protein
MHGEYSGNVALVSRMDPTQQLADIQIAMLLRVTIMFTFPGSVIGLNGQKEQFGRNGMAVEMLWVVAWC